MILETGNMWTAWDRTDLFLITTNASVKADGKLVMGRGIAREARDRFQGLDLVLGQRIAKANAREKRYGLLLPDVWRVPFALSQYETLDEYHSARKAKKLGAFQVKFRWHDLANHGLISYSARQLKAFAEKEFGAVEIHMNFPGIGNGGLEPDGVYALIEDLPNNVHVWTKSPIKLQPGD